jgi:hypothetical protein
MLTTLASFVILRSGDTSHGPIRDQVVKCTAGLPSTAVDPEQYFAHRLAGNLTAVPRHWALQLAKNVIVANVASSMAALCVEHTCQPSATTHHLFNHKGL